LEKAHHNWKERKEKSSGTFAANNGGRSTKRAGQRTSKSSEQEETSGSHQGMTFNSAKPRLKKKNDEEGGDRPPNG